MRKEIFDNLPTHFFACNSFPFMLDVEESIEERNAWCSDDGCPDRHEGCGPFVKELDALPVCVDNEEV
jgi:hypothetical protein